MATTIEAIQTMVERLSPADQRRVLQFVQELAKEHQVLLSLSDSPLQKGKPGNVLPDPKPPLEIVEEEVVEEIEQAPADSEKIDVDEW